MLAAVSQIGSVEHTAEEVTEGRTLIRGHVMPSLETIENHLCFPERLRVRELVGWSCVLSGKRPVIRGDEPKSVGVLSIVIAFLRQGGRITGRIVGQTR